MPKIRKATIKDIALIRELALNTWPVCYKGIISDEQIVYMLNLIYSETALKDQITNLQHQFILVHVSEQPAGFASYSLKPGENNKVFRLNKLYVLPDQQGKQLGKNLLNYIVEEIKQLHANALELNVNKDNPALHFYTKNHFTITTSEVISIGNGYVMDDFIMTRVL